MGCNESLGVFFCFFVTHLYNVIIKEQPEAVALHDGDVMPTVGATAGKGIANLLARSQNHLCSPSSTSQLFAGKAF